MVVAIRGVVFYSYHSVSVVAHLTTLKLFLERQKGSSFISNPVYLPSLEVLSS